MQTQQTQPAVVMPIMQSQQAWIMAQQDGSPLVQVMQTPSLVGSHLHMPIAMLQQHIIMPFIIMQQLHMPPAIIEQRFWSIVADMASSLARNLHAAGAFFHLDLAPRHHHPLRGRRHPGCRAHRACAGGAHTRHSHAGPFHYHCGSHRGFNSLMFNVASSWRQTSLSHPPDGRHYARDERNFNIKLQKYFDSSGPSYFGW